MIIAKFLRTENKRMHTVKRTCAGRPPTGEGGPRQRCPRDHRRAAVGKTGRQDPVLKEPWMNDATWALVTDVVERVQRAISMMDCPAIVILDGDRRQILSDYDYLRDEDATTAFERKAAAHAKAIHAHRFAFAVPQVIVETVPGTVQARAVSNHPLRPGEQETVAWTAYDAADGVDYGWAPYTRRPNNEPVFGPPEIFDMPVKAAERMPGVRLLRLLTGA